MRELWETKTLGEVCDLITRGIAPKYIENDGICVLNQKCIREHVINYDFARRHDAAGKFVNSDRLIQLGDVLINSTGTGTLGRVAQVREPPIEPTTVDTHVTIVRPRAQKFCLEFFGYMLIQIEEEIKSSGEGASGQTELARNIIENRFKVSFPSSLAEQKRIVAILDEAFEGIAAAKANAEKNLANARELFESYLNAVFTTKGEGWKEKQLSTLCHRITVGHVGSMAKRYKEAGVPFLRSQNIRRFEVSMENVVFIDDAFHTGLAKSSLCPGDLASVRTGYPGTAAVIPPWLENANCSDLVIIRPSSDVNPHFLAAFFNSTLGKELVLGKIVGAAQKHFNITAAKEVMLCYPPVRHQETIVESLESMRINSERLEAIYQQKIIALAELKQSILQKAFAGELTSLAAQALPDAAE